MHNIDHTYSQKSIYYIHNISMYLCTLGVLKNFYLRNIFNHTWFLKARSSSKATEHPKNDLKCLIYQRTNETFFVSKSFFWRRRRHDNSVASLLKGQGLLFSWSVWISKSKITRIRAKIFSLFICLCTFNVSAPDRIVSIPFLSFGFNQDEVSTHLSQEFRLNSYTYQFK